MYLAEKAPEFFPGASFAVVHCNFTLRGGESDSDEAFVRSWCEEHSMQLYCTRFDTAAYASSEGLSIEMAARKLRYRRFAEICRNDGFNAVAVAHNANDEAETFLLNLLRGTGTRGLRGMAADTVVEGARVLRPMLGISRREILSWMTQNGRTWREDSSNSDGQYKRNRLRSRVLPEFEAVNPAFLRTLKKDMAHIGEVDDIADSYWETALDEGLLSKDGMTLNLNVLKRYTHSNYLLYRFMDGRGFSEDTVGALQKAVGNGSAAGKIFEAGEWLLECASGRLLLRPRGQETAGMNLTIDAPGTYDTASQRIIVEVCDAAELKELRQPEGTQIFGALRFPFTVRSRRDGDWLNPLGLRGRKKLSDLFNDLGYSPSEKRSALAVVEGDGSSSHISALLGKRIDEAQRVTSRNTEILRIHLIPKL